MAQKKQNTAQNTRVTEDEIAQKIATARGKKVEDVLRNSLGGGIPLRTKRTLTGKVIWNDKDKDKTFHHYAFECDGGEEIAFKQLSGIPTLSGYIMGETAIDSKGREHTSEVVDDLSLDSVHYMKERNECKAIAHYSNNPDLTAGKTAEYLGNILKKIVLKKDQKFNDIDYKKGDFTYVSVKLWSLS